MENKLADKIEKLGAESLYDKQGDTFLKETGVLIEVLKAIPQTAPHWEQGNKHGIQYSVRLAKLNPDTVVKLEKGQVYGAIDDNRRHITEEIQFFYWGSIKDKEKNPMKKPTAYDILASIYTPIDTFENFCADFGFNEDSRTAEHIYKEVQELNAKLARVFTQEELEALQTIR